MMTWIHTLALVVGLAAHAHGQTQGNAIVGTWRGTSTCVDKEHFPSCNDEQAIYEVRQRGSSRDTVTVRAGKMVNGVNELVSEDDFARQPDGSWSVEIKTPRFRVLLRLRVSGDRMTGTLTDGGSNRKVRDISLQRVR